MSVSLNRILVNADIVLVENVNACSRILAQCSMLSKYPVKVEVDYADNNLTSSPGNYVACSLDSDLQAVKKTTGIASDFEEDLDHIVLKERQRLLLSRCCLLFDGFVVPFKVEPFVEKCKCESIILSP